MSTYTDLHSKVKEAINVDYYNRITPQTVRFLNEQNEYWGTLKGNISAEDIYINGGTLSNVSLADVKITGSLVTESGIDFYKIGNDITDLSNKTKEIESDLNDFKSQTGIDFINVDKNINEFKDQTERNFISVNSDINNFKIQTESKFFVVDTNLSNLSNALSNQSGSTGEVINQLCTQLCTYIDNISAYADNISAYANDISVYADNISADTHANINAINSEISIVKIDLANEIYDRVTEETKLQTQLEQYDRDSLERDFQLRDELAEHIQENNESFECANDVMLSTVAHDKHYEINDQGTTDSYPYKAKDYCINVFRTNVPDAHVTYTDSNNKTVDIGQITLDSNASASTTTFLPFTFTTYANVDSPITSAIVDAISYKFSDTQTFVETGINNYIVKLDSPIGNTDITKAKLKLVPQLLDYHKVYLSGTNEVIGQVNDNDQPTPETNLSGGVLYIDTTNSDLVTFNKFRKLAFDFDNNKLQIGADRIIYEGNNVLRLEKNVSEDKFISLIDQLNTSHELFGRIYEYKDGISGVIYDTDGSVNEINANLFIDNGYKAKLNKANNFYQVVTSTDVVETVLSGSFSDNTHVNLDVVLKSELYGYPFTGSDSTGQIVECGQIIPQVYNKKLIDNPDYLTVEADISKIMWIKTFVKKVMLSKADSTEQYWTYQETDENKNTLYVKFDGQKLTVKTTSVDDLQIISQEYEVKINSPVIVNENYNIIKYQTGFIDLTDISETLQIPEATYYGTIDPGESADKYAEYVLDIDTNACDSLKIEFPDKPFEDVSREFFITIKLDSLIDRPVKAEFIYSDGTPVTYYNNKKTELYLQASPDEKSWTTYMVNEVRQNRFLITDLNDYEDHQILAKLQADVKYLSSEIDVDKSNISTISSDVISISSIVDEKYEKLISDDASVLLSAKTYAKSYSDDISTSLSTTISTDYTTKAEVKSLSTDIVKDITNIQTVISGNDGLCDHISDLEYHYDRTFTEDTYTSGPDTKFDVLKIVDSQNTNNKFKLIYLSGTLVLQKIND